MKIHEVYESNQPDLIDVRPARDFALDAMDFALDDEVHEVIHLAFVLPTPISATASQESIRD